VLVARILAHLDYLEEAITELSKQIEEQIRPFEQEVQWLMTTIPGVGSNTAQVIVAEVGVNPAQFGGAAQLENWAGMCPATMRVPASIVRARPAKATVAATGLGGSCQRSDPEKKLRLGGSLSPSDSARRS
jgi:transposase